MGSSRPGVSTPPRRPRREPVDLRVEIVVLGRIEGLVRASAARRRPLHRRGAIVEIAAERALARVEIERGDPAAGAASATALCTAVVDLPVPPFSLAKTMKCGLRQP
jgi:hypothetical protein